MSNITATDVYATIDGTTDPATIASIYADMDRTERATLRRLVIDGMSTAIGNRDMELAMVMVAIKDTINEPVKKTVDYAPVYAARITALRAAADVMELVANHNAIDLPDTAVDSSIITNVFASITDADANIELSDIESTIAKLVRIPRANTPNRTYTGARRSVDAHIASAFADVESGTFKKVSEIVAHRSAEYGDDAPTGGAVSAALNAAREIDGIQTTTRDGRLGAIKI